MKNQAFLNKQTFFENKDNKGLYYYLNLVGDFKSQFKPFHVVQENGFNIIDESVSCPVGFKARAGELLVLKALEMGYDELVYVQPRRGFAGISLSYLCNIYDMKLTLVMPSSKLISDHQALCLEYGAHALFTRVAAMPNASTQAQKYVAKDNKKRLFIPLGLQHELVTAVAVSEIHNYFKDKEHPKVMWSVISTGVLSRALQIALPNTRFKAVAVARNIQQGELGRATFYSYHKPFESVSDLIPQTFDCENSYDAKGWDYMNEYGNVGDWFFNVAGNAPKSTIDKTQINSYRYWRDYSDFE